MRRTRGALPAQLPAAEAEEALRSLTRFLARALPLCRAHTTEFYVRGLWEQLVAARPEVVLQALRRPLPEASGSAAVLWGESRRGVAVGLGQGPGDTCALTASQCGVSGGVGTIRFCPRCSHLFGLLLSVAVVSLCFNKRRISHHSAELLFIPPPLPAAFLQPFPQCCARCSAFLEPFLVLHACMCTSSIHLTPVIATSLERSQYHLGVRN